MPGGIDWGWVGAGVAVMLGFGLAAFGAGCPINPGIPDQQPPGMAASLGHALATGVLLGSAFGLEILAIASATALFRARRWRGPGQAGRRDG